MAAFPLCVTHNRRVFKNTYEHFDENLVVHEELCIVSADIKGKGKGHSRTGHEAPKVVEVYLYSFFNFSARWDGWSTPRPGHFTPGKDPVPIV